MTRVLVAGLALDAEAYPNGAETIRMLRRMPGVDVVDRRVAPLDGMHLWKLRRSGGLAAARTLLRLLRATAGGMSAAFRHRRSVDAMYLPYPALPILWLLSWLPRSWRPPLIADAFISVWDASCIDRAKAGAHGWRCRLLHALERRALRTADRVICDTTANRDAFVGWFGLEPERVVAFPLAVDAARFVALRGLRHADVPAPLRVLFFGTMVPLHGIGVVLQAARQLRDHPGIRFVLVGDGQEGPRIAEFLAEGGGANLEWQRGWSDLAGIAAHMAQADVCLGVFGGHGKSARVLPFKLYYAMAAGMPVISQAAYSLPEGCPPPPITGCTPADAASLAAALERLLADPSRLPAMAEASAAYFDAQLSRERLQGHWQALLRTLEHD